MQTFTLHPGSPMLARGKSSLPAAQIKIWGYPLDGTTTPQSHQEILVILLSNTSGFHPLLIVSTAHTILPARTDACKLHPCYYSSVRNVLVAPGLLRAKPCPFLVPAPHPVPCPSHAGLLAMPPTYKGVFLCFKRNPRYIIILAINSSTGTPNRK